MTQETQDELAAGLDYLIKAYNEIDQVKSESYFIRIANQFMAFLQEADKKGSGDNYVCWKYIISHLTSLPKKEESLPTGEGEPAMVKIDGKSFRCPCGCNVFTKYDNLMYRCNACNTYYQGT